MITTSKKSRLIEDRNIALKDMRMLCEVIDEVPPVVRDTCWEEYEQTIKFIGEKAHRLRDEINAL